MSNEKAQVKAIEVDVDGEATPEQEAQRRTNLAHLIVFANAKILDIENRMMDRPHIAAVPQLYQEALKWSNVQQWCTNIMANRFIMPEQQAKHKAEQEEKAKSKIITF